MTTESGEALDFGGETIGEQTTSEAPKRQRRAKAKAEAGNEDAPRPAGKRAAAEKSRRRRRGSNDKTTNFKLGLRMEKDPDYEYRWINEGIDGSRLKAKTVDDDWDQVHVDDDGDETTSEGAAVRRVVGENKSGPIYAYLCRKPKEFFEDDYRKSQRYNDKLMEQVSKGPGGDIRGLQAKDNAYIPEEGISIGNG